jgi:DNA invertase Pin-like site-specific DNA recombinase
MTPREPVTMTPQAREAFTRMVGDVLADWESKISIERVRSSLLDALEQGSFNTGRARELFQMPSKNRFGESTNQPGP